MATIAQGAGRALRTDIAQGAAPLTLIAGVRVLAVPAGSWGRTDEATVNIFASTPEGAELVKEWGVRADRNVATVRGRIGVMMKSMAPDDRRAAEAWFDGLPAAHAKAVMLAQPNVSTKPCPRKMVTGHKWGQAVNLFGRGEATETESN